MSDTVRKTARPRDIAIVGAGLGGLALAARLQHRGHRVTLIEKNGEAGGRCGTIDIDGFHFDTGPTLLLMPDVVQTLFSRLDRKLEDYLDLRRLDPNYRLHFPDGSSFDFVSDRARMVPILNEIEEGAGAAFGEFLDEAGFCYGTARAHFVEKNFRTAREFFTTGNLAMLFRMQAHRRLYGRISRWFRDDRLRQAFSFQTMYLGLSPYQSPALYTLLPFTEFEEGIWYPMGGMHQLALAIEKAFLEDGGRTRYNAPVAQIERERGRATGVTLESGERVAADVVIANADLPYAKEALLDEKPRKWKYTSSGFLLHLGLRRRYEHAPHHSVIFSEDYSRNFREIFRDKSVPSDPAFYICRPSATDPSVAPEGKDVLYVLSPMPHLEGNVDWASAAPLLREHFISRLERLGFEGIRDEIEVERCWTPVDFKEKLNLAAGCAFGLSHDMSQVGWLRPHNRDRNCSNLYYVGASTHPGTGIPMVLFSAALVEQRIAEEQE